MQLNTTSQQKLKKRKKGKKTKNIWYYQFVPDRSLGKTSPLNENDLADFRDLYSKRSETENSWNIRLSDVDQNTFDLSAKNPNTPEEAPLRQPNEILEAMASLDKKSETVLKSILDLI